MTVAAWSLEVLRLRLELQFGRNDLNVLNDWNDLNAVTVVTNSRYGSSPSLVAPGAR